MAQEQKQSFIKGAAILSAAALIVKVLGLLFSIPLGNIISPEGMSYFYVAYDIFGFFLLLSTTGLPIAVSRMVGAAYSQGRRKEADRAFSVAFWLFFGLGLLGCLMMVFFSEPIAQYVSGISGAAPCIVALAPTMFFISVMSALRGYFQGRSNMVPTAVSQVIEAVSKVIIGVGLALYIISSQNSDSMAAVGAIVGVSISAGLGTLYLTWYWLRQKRRDRDVEGDPLISDSRRQILRNLVVFAVPITLGACFLSMLDLADSRILVDRLMSGAALTEDRTEYLRGVLGHARKFFDLPGAFVVPISTCLLPVLSGAIARRDQKSIDHISTISMRVTFLISIPATLGMLIFSQPICELLLFNKPEAAMSTAPLLMILSIAICFNSTLYTTNAVLQSFDKAVVPVVTMAVGGVVKLILSYTLIGIPEINAMGAAISTVVSYALIMVLNFIAVRKVLPHMESPLKTAFPMVLAALVMAAVSYGVYFLLSLAVGNKIAVVPAIVVAVVVYAFCAVRVKAIRYEDLEMLPKGEVLARLLRVRKPVE